MLTKVKKIIFTSFLCVCLVFTSLFSVNATTFDKGPVLQTSSAFKDLSFGVGSSSGNNFTATVPGGESVFFRGDTLYLVFSWLNSPLADGDVLPSGATVTINFCTSFFSQLYTYGYEYPPDRLPENDYITLIDTIKTPSGVVKYTDIITVSSFNGDVTSSTIKDYMNYKNATQCEVKKITSDFAAISNFSINLTTKDKTSGFVVAFKAGLDNDLSENFAVNSYFATFNMIIEDIELKAFEEEYEFGNEESAEDLEDSMSAMPQIDGQDGFFSGLSTLLVPMTYSERNAYWWIDPIYIPAIRGITDKIILYNGGEIDLLEFAYRLPTDLVELVRMLTGAGLLMYCIKELYSLISWALTLKGGSAD